MSKATPDKDWEAPIETNEFTEAIRYTARAGFNDMIVILTKCKSTPRHWTGKKFPMQKFYLRCLEEENAECCKLLGKPSASNSVYIIHVAERPVEGDGTWTIVGKPKVWGFNDKTRGTAILPIYRDTCKKDDAKFRKTLIIVTCVSQQWQTVALNVYPDTDIKVTKEMKLAAKENMNMFIEDITIDRDDILQSVERLKALTGGTKEDEPQTEAPAEEVAAAPAETTEGDGDEPEEEEIDFDKQMEDFEKSLESGEEE